MSSFVWNIGKAYWFRIAWAYEDGSTDVGCWVNLFARLYIVWGNGKKWRDK